MRLRNYCENLSMETIFMENSKTNEPHKFVLNLRKLKKIKKKI